jgi:hypothetical protein
MARSLSLPGPEGKTDIEAAHTRDCGLYLANAAVGLKADSYALETEAADEAGCDALAKTVDNVFKALREYEEKCKKVAELASVGLVCPGSDRISEHIGSVSDELKACAQKHGATCHAEMMKKRDLAVTRLTKVHKGMADGGSWKDGLDDKAPLHAEETVGAFVKLKDAYCTAIAKRILELKTVPFDLDRLVH